MNPALTTLFILAVTASMPETERPSEERAWEYLCASQDLYSCEGLDPPPVEYVKFKNPDFLGYYNGEKVLMSEDLIDVQMVGMTAHEMMHYLQHRVGGFVPPMTARVLCPLEDEAWKMVSIFYIENGRPDMVNENWYKKYPECQLFHLTQKEPWNLEVQSGP